MIVPDVLWGKLFIVVGCEGFAVFSGIVGINMVKDEIGGRSAENRKI